MIVSIDENQLNGLSSLLKAEILKVVDEIKNQVSMKNDNKFEKSELYGCCLDDEFILEWINGWGRVQFVLCEDEDYEEIVYMDNRKKEKVPHFSYLEYDLNKITEIVSDASEFIASFS